MANSVRFHSKKIIWFDAAAYVDAVGKELKTLLYKLREELRASILAQLHETNFKKNNLVRLADGNYTNDIERSAALMASVLWDPIVNDVGKALRTTVYAMRDNFEDTHIGWYYEYGTGTKQDEAAPIKGYDGTPQNRLRAVGAPIVTRSKFINGGVWRDLGGNMRLSKAIRAGVTDEKFLKYIDQETDAEYWFAEGVRQVRRDFNERILTAIKSVPINRKDFWHIRDFTIGKD